MKVLFDHQIFSYQNYGGISRYFSELLNNLFEDKNSDIELSLKYSNNSYLKEINNVRYKSFLKDLSFNRKPGILNVLNSYYSRKEIRKKNFDIFHPTFYNPYFLNCLNGKPFVFTIFDMIGEIFPPMFSAQKKISGWKKELIKKADYVIAISNNTKEDIKKIYNIRDNKIKVIHLATSLGMVKPKKPSINLPQTYLLFVGDRSFYKNFTFFIKSAVPILKKEKDLCVVCAGGSKFSNDEIILFKDSNIGHKIYHVPIDDQFLAYLYRNALAFIFPSLYEGFGIPALEAISCSCPTLLSNVSSLPEVGGDAALYFDPEDQSSLREALLEIIKNKSLRDLLKEKAKKQVKKFSWSKTSEETLNLYRKI